MARAFSPKVVTANDLLEGDVIYMSASGTWTRGLASAKLFEDSESAESALAQANAQQGVAVGAYLANAKAGSHGPEPVHFKEDFRRTGPSNYFHGKQDEQSRAQKVA